MGRSEQRFVFAHFWIRRSGANTSFGLLINIKSVVIYAKLQTICIFLLLAKLVFRVAPFAIGPERARLCVRLFEAISFVRFIRYFQLSWNFALEHRSTIKAPNQTKSSRLLVASPTELIDAHRSGMESARHHQTEYPI